MTEDMDWARDLFDRSRAGAEPVWVADHVGMARAGRRRAKVRTLTASGGSLAVVAAVAVTATAVVGSGSGSGNAIHKPVTATTRPATPTDPSKIFQYFSANGSSTKDNKPVYNTLTRPGAVDLAALVDKLDPTHSHLRADSDSSAGTIVPVDDPIALDTVFLAADGVWTADATAKKPGVPNGMLSVAFQNSSSGLGAGESGCGVGRILAPSFNPLDPVPVPGEADATEDGASWTPCAGSKLQDGSTVLSSTKSYKDFVLASAVRIFPGDTGAIAILWMNFEESASSGPVLPDPRSVLSPSPITAKQLVEALSGPAIVAGLPSTPVVAVPSDLPQAADFGTGWTFDSSQPHSTTGDLVADNGCDMQQNPVATVEPVAVYEGATPSGEQVQATAEVYVMAKGSGPSWMADLRSHGTGGCDQGPGNELKYSEDSMSPLPSGTGDDAFVENWYGQGSYTFMIRFGDSIMRVDITKPDGSTGANTMPTFTQADKDWLTAVAQKAAARYIAAHK